MDFDKGSFYKEQVFGLPIVSHIVGNLWLGGSIDGLRLPDDFVHVVSLEVHKRYVLGPGTSRVEMEMDDARYLPNLVDLHTAAGRAVGGMRDARTLVHCQAGQNRSALVAGLALILQGFEPERAIGLLRERRSPRLLNNGTFEHWLLTYKRDI